MMFKTGWPRWLFLAVAAILFLLITAIICGGTDYRRDPSALVPRSAYFYAETRELDQVFARSGNWPIWKGEMQNTGTDQWSRIQVSLAGMIGNKVAGLGTRLPLIWLSGAKMAAFCLTEGENGAPESWAIYLDAGDAAQFLSELGVEPGFTFAKAANAPDGVFELTGTGAGSLFFGVMNPWLIVASDAKLPVFAAESMKKPAFSLANSGILADWRRNVLVRGMINPAYMTSRSNTVSPFTILGGWTRPEARLAFSTSLDKDGEMDCRMVATVLSDQSRGGGILWPVVKFVLFWVGLLCLLLIVGTISVMIGWAGWLKSLAVKAGIAPAPAPATVEPSPAFQEDTGAKGGDAGSVAEAKDESPVASSADESSSSMQSGSGITESQDVDDKGES